MVRIKEEFWKNGGRIPKEMQEFLSKEEKAFIAEYKKLNETYQQSSPISIDLSKVKKSKFIIFRI